MAIEFPGAEEEELTIFPHSNRFSQGIGKIRIGQATVVVALDGSGDAGTIQEGFDVLPPGGGVVVLKEGIYDILKTLVTRFANTALVGAGKGAQIKTSTNIKLLDVPAGQNGFLMNKIFLNGSGAGNAANVGLDLNSNDECRITGNWFAALGSTGLDMDESEKSIATNNNFTQIVGNSVMVNGITNILTHNQITQCTLSGIKIDTGGQCVVANNHIFNNTNHGIHMNAASDCVVNSNKISEFDNGETGNFDGIFLEGNSDRNSLNGNTCVDGFGYGINISAAACNFNNIISNILLGNDVGPYQDLGTGTEIGHNQTS